MMRSSIAALASLLVVVGCQWIADIDEKSFVPGSGGASTSARVVSASASTASAGAGGGDVCLMMCGGVCVNSLTDSNHCGSCNVHCPGGVACDGGLCGRSLFRGAGSDSPCAVFAGGELRCWGANDDYQGGLGNAISPATYAFKATVTQPNVRSVASSWDATCALLTNGGVSCFGANSNGEIGEGDTAGSKTCSDGKCVPLAWPTLPSGIDEIAGGGSFIAGAHFCARTTSRKVSCWGKLGAAKVVSPTEVEGLDDIVQIASGVAFDCFLHATGRLSCRGSNARGQLGQGDFAAYAGLVEVPLTSVTTIGAGVSHLCARAGDKVYCWGANPYGQVGNGLLDGIDVPKPTAVTADGLEDVVEIAGALEATCALTAVGDVFCWGRGDYGLLGSGANLGVPCSTGDSCAPMPIKAIFGGAVFEIALGGFAGLARRSGDVLYAWGGNAAGQLASGALLSSSVPAPIKMLP